MGGLRRPATAEYLHLVGETGKRRSPASAGPLPAARRADDEKEEDDEGEGEGTRRDDARGTWPHSDISAQGKKTCHLRCDKRMNSQTKTGSRGHGEGTLTKRERGDGGKEGGAGEGKGGRVIKPPFRTKKYVWIRLGAGAIAALRLPKVRILAARCISPIGVWCPKMSPLRTV